MDAPAERGIGVHTAIHRRNGRVEIGYVCLRPDLSPVAVGGWKVVSSDAATVRRKTVAVAVTHATDFGRPIRVAAEPRSPKATACRDADDQLMVDVERTDPSATHPTEVLASGFARGGLTNRYRGRLDACAVDALGEVALYTDGSSRDGGTKTTGGYIAVGPRGRVLSFAGQPVNANGHLGAEFRAAEMGIKWATACGIRQGGRMVVVTDNRRVARTLSTEEATGESASEAVDALTAARSCATCTIREVDRRETAVADALARHGHVRSVRAYADEAAVRD